MTNTNSASANGQRTEAPKIDINLFDFNNPIMKRQKATTESQRLLYDMVVSWYCKGKGRKNTRGNISLSSFATKHNEVREWQTLSVGISRVKKNSVVVMAFDYPHGDFANINVYEQTNKSPNKQVVCNTIGYSHKILESIGIEVPDRDDAYVRLFARLEPTDTAKVYVIRPLKAEIGDGVMKHYITFDENGRIVKPRGNSTTGQPSGKLF